MAGSYIVTCQKRWKLEGIVWGEQSTPLLGNMEGGSLTRDFERWMKRALEVEHLSLRETWSRGLLYSGPWRMCKGRLWRQASLSIGAPLGNLEGGSYTGDNER